MALALAIVAAVLFAASLRLASLVSTLLAAYVAYVVEVGAVTWALSPLRAVTPLGLTLAEALLALIALAVWWLRGRPGVELAAAARSVRAIAADPVAAGFLAVAALALAYELLLALGVPPTNWDSLTYHLARVAAWDQHHGISWIPNAPTARMNEFQPLAEQQILFLFVATGSTALYALPQFVAELAILVAVYGAARRLGFDGRTSAMASALLATFSLVALQASTAQNDLVAASFAAVAACLLLGRSEPEALLAGVAAGAGLGAKLTTALVVPVLAWLAWTAGRRCFRLALAGGVLGFATAGAWGFVLNLAHTGNLLGHGEGRVENTQSPTPLSTLRTIAHLLDRLIDSSVIPHWTIALLAAAGVASAVAVAFAARADGGRARAVAAGAVALPLLAPAVVLALSHIPAGDPSWIEHEANEDYSAFGPLGSVALVAAPIATVIAVRRRDSRQLALALALPSYIVLLSLYAKYNIWITRFLLVPVVLTAPLFARLLRNRLTAASVLVVAALSVGLTLAHDATKPLGGPLGRPWQLDQAQAVAEGSAQPTDRDVAAALSAYERLVPPRACVGAVLDPDEPSYLLYGPDLRHRVVYLSSLSALQEAYASGLGYVVVSTGANAPVSNVFARAGWTLRPLASYWTLAVAGGRARGAPCH